MPCFPRFVLTAAALACGLGWSIAALGGDEPNGGAATEPAVLVEQLGSGSYAAREQAARRLTELGLAARDALVQGLDSPDAEVRARAGCILEVVQERDFQARLRAFAADQQTNAAHGLAGWDRFVQLAGDGGAARRLFVSMQREESSLLEAAEADARLAGALLEDRARQAREGVYDDMFGARRIAVGRVAAIVFVAARQDIALSDETADAVVFLLGQQIVLATARSGPLAPPLSKLAAAWIERSLTSSPLTRVQSLSLADKLGLRDECLRLALSIAPDAEQMDAFARGVAILTVGRLGGLEQVAALKPLLADATVCNDYEADGRRWQCQVRDAALYALLRLHGQDPKEYDFTFLGDGDVSEPTALGFATEKQRAAALDRWKKWSKGHQGSGE